MDCPACHQPNVDGARFCAKCGALLPLPSSGVEDALIGQIIGGRYRITQLLGEGGMGRVYLGEQQMGTNVRKVAVKTLQSQFAKDTQILARFHRECGTVSELEHPNTIQFFDFGQTPDGQLYIAMEYVQGESLSSALSKGPMQPDRALHILAQVCGSLEEAHNRGVVHRDLKPDNVILTVRAGQPDFVKVLDFGIAKRSEAKDAAQEQKLTQQGMVLGTPPYMSPEQFTGKELDARSDIYSLGVMAYEMLTGRLPFEADTPWQWATQHMTAQPFPFETSPASANIPLMMKGAIMRALSKDREQRQKSARRFYDELAGAAPTAMAGPDAGALAARSGTAAMPAPDLAAIGAASALGGPATGAMPVAYTPPAQPAYGAPPPPAPMHPAAPTGPSRTGLIIGLGAAAGVLAVVGIIIVVRSSRPKDDIIITSPFPGGGGAATASATGSAVPEPALSFSALPIPTPPPQQTAGAGTAKKPPPVPKGDAACLEARKQAENGDIPDAVRYYGSCEGPSQASAKAAIARRAPEAVQKKVFNGDCAGARAVLASAKSVGAAGNGDAVLAGSKCK